MGNWDGDWKPSEAMVKAERDRIKETERAQRLLSETPTDEILRESEKRLSNKIVEGDASGMQLKFDSMPMMSEDDMAVADYCKRHGFTVENAMWERVTNVVWKIGEHEINISSFLPEDYRVYAAGTAFTNGAVSRTDKRIYLQGHLSAPDTLLTLLHEVGHVQDFISEVPKETTLARERRATAFAFNILRPVFRENIEFRADALNVLKYLALADYSRFEQPPGLGMSQGDIDFEMGWEDDWVDDAMPSEDAEE